MSLDQVLTLAPQIALALLGIGVLAFLISLRSFSVSRSPTFWRRRRAAGQRGWRLFLLSVFFFVLSGATCGIGSIGSRILSQQIFQQTPVALIPTVEIYRALTGTAASWTDTPLPLPSLTPTVNPTATLAAPTEDSSATAVALQQTLDSTFTTMISETLTALPQTLTAVAISIAQQTPPPAPTEAATIEVVTVFTDAPAPSATNAPTDQPTLTPTATATEAATQTPTAIPPTATDTATIEASATPITPTITETPTITLTASETLTPTPSETPTLTFTPTTTQTPTVSPTSTETLIPVAVAPIQTLSSSITPSADARLRITALSAEISNDFKPINPAQEFAAGIRRVYFFVEFDAMQPGVLWRRELRLNDEVILQGTYLWGQLITGTTFFYFGQPNGFPVGNYEIRLYLGVGETPIDAAAFIVK